MRVKEEVYVLENVEMLQGVLELLPTEGSVLHGIVRDIDFSTESGIPYAGFRFAEYYEPVVEVEKKFGRNSKSDAVIFMSSATSASYFKFYNAQVVSPLVMNGWLNPDLLGKLFSDVIKKLFQFDLSVNYNTPLFHTHAKVKICFSLSGENPSSITFEWDSKDGGTGPSFLSDVLAHCRKEPKTSEPQTLF